MRRLLTGLVGLVAGYAVAGLLGYWALQLLFDNAFDRSVEVSMTVLGPAGALVNSSGASHSAAPSGRQEGKCPGAS